MAVQVKRSKALLFAEHGENMLCTKIVLNVRNNFCTQHVLPRPRFELGIFMYWTWNSMNNLLSYWVRWWKNESFWQRFTCTTWQFLQFLYQNGVNILFLLVKPIEMKSGFTLKLMKKFARWRCGCCWNIWHLNLKTKISRIFLHYQESNGY